MQLMATYLDGLASTSLVTPLRGGDDDAEGDDGDAEGDDGDAEGDAAVCLPSSSCVLQDQQFNVFLRSF